MRNERMPPARRRGRPQPAGFFRPRHGNGVLGPAIDDRSGLAASGPSLPGSQKSAPWPSPVWLAGLRPSARPFRTPQPAVVLAYVMLATKWPHVTLHPKYRCRHGLRGFSESREINSRVSGAADSTRRGTLRRRDSDDVKVVGEPRVRTMRTKKNRLWSLAHDCNRHGMQDLRAFINQEGHPVGVPGRLLSDVWRAIPAQTTPNDPIVTPAIF
jgi:hypothetical protein